MNIKELPLLFTVRARVEIGALAGHSMQDFYNELSKGNEDKAIDLTIKAYEVMHNCYLRSKALEDGKEFEPVSLNKDEFLDLTAYEWNEIESRIVETIQKDSGIEVETTSKKKEEKQN